MVKSNNMDTDITSRSTGRRLPIPGKDSATCNQDINNWKDGISKVDTSMTRLAIALDVLHAIPNAIVGPDKPDDKQLNEAQSLRHLIMCSSRMVLDNRDSTISTVRSFLHFVIGMITQANESSVEMFEPLSLDSLDKQSREKELCQHIQDSELERLKRDNADLMSSVSMLQREITVFTATENGILKENDNLREKINVLEQYKSLKEQNESGIRKAKVSDISARNGNSSKEKEINSLEQKNKELTKRCKMLQEESDEQRAEKESEYQKEIADLKIENDLLDSSITEKGKEITRLKGVVETLSKQKEDNEKKLNETIKAMKKDNEILKMGIAELSTKYENIESDSKSEKETNRKQNEENKETINMLCMQIDEANSKMKEHDSLKKDFQVLKRKHDASKYDVQKKEQEIKTLQSNLKVLEEERKESNRRNTELKEEIKTVMLEKESLHNELGKEKERHDSELRKSKDLSNKVAVLSTERETLLSENINLQQELETYKSKKIIQVQLYYQRRGELITTVEEELTRILKQRIESTGRFEIEFVKCMHVSEVVTDLPLLLLCICASRIGTDAANTIQGLRLTSKVSLLIFHHKDIHALPSQASYQVLTGGEYKTMSGIFDLAFLSGKGIYSCPLNDTSIAKIITFIKSEYVQSSSEGLSR